MSSQRNIFPPPTIFSRGTIQAGLTVLLLVVVGLLGYRAGGAGRGTKTSEKESVSPLFISPANLNFGEVWEDSAFNLAIPIQNQGSEETEITELVSSCGCTKVTPTSLVIPAGESREIKLTLDLTAGHTAGNDPRDFKVAIRAHVNGLGGEKRQAGWIVRGKVRSLLHIRDAFLDFGSQSQFDQQLQPRQTIATSVVPLSGLTAASTSSFFDVGVSRASKNPAEFEIRVRPTGKIPAGEIQSRISLVPWREGKPLPTAAISLRGRVLADVQAAPDEIVFGARSVGVVCEETVTLQSLSQRPFKIDAVTLQGDGLTVERAENGDSGLLRFQVKQNVRRTGSQHGSIRFQIKQSDTKDRDILVRVSYYGLQK